METSTLNNGHSEQNGQLLSRTAYSETALPSLRLARSSRRARRFGKFLLFMLVAGFFLVAIAPWQQSVRGSGDVIAFDPSERPQTVEATVKGRIKRLGEGIYENAYVKEGQLIAEISDIAPEYLALLQQQLTASQDQLDAARDVLSANQRNKASAEMVVLSLDSQVVTYKLLKAQIVAAAEAAVMSAANKVDAETQVLAENKAVLAQATADYERQMQLFKEMIASQLKFQEAEQKWKAATAKVLKSEFYIKSATNELEAKRNERQAKEQKANVDIDNATAKLREANAKVAKAESEVAKSQTEVNKAEKDFYEAKTKVARQQSQDVTAPFAGYVTWITPNLGSKVLKEGDPICVIVPDTTDRAVRIWLDGNDAPLVEPGRHVRLQFEGWPAVQFAGWPSVAVGTFGGRVVSVDATDNAKGKFRILVVPDPEDRPWPNVRFLRQGVRANGWVLLEQVPLWYEIWRNMNGFPPVVSTEEPKGEGKKPKVPKP